MYLLLTFNNFAFSSSVSIVYIEQVNVFCEEWTVTNRDTEKNYGLF